MKRTFIAIKVNPSREFEYFYNSIRTEIQGGINWYETKKLHLTLGFFESTSNEQEEQIKIALKKICAQTEPFTLDFQGLGVFHSKKEPGVIWIGLMNTHIITKVYEDLWLELGSFGLSRDMKKFTPHITIGRIKYKVDKEQLTQLISGNCKRKIMKSTVREFTYYESTLTPTGSVYRVLGRFQLV